MPPHTAPQQQDLDLSFYKQRVAQLEKEVRQAVCVVVM
jgi:hypothetical protein